MSDKPKFPLEQARLHMMGLVSLLKNHCEPDRCIIAGSIRRKKPFVGDGELLFVPRYETRDDPNDMFGKIRVSLADEEIARWERGGIIGRRPSSIGVFTWGPKNKLGILMDTGMPVDLFATTEENWYTSLVIRTGGKETNLMLTTGAQRLGRKLHAYGAGVEWGGETHRANSEQEVFHLCGVPYIEVEQRK